MNKIGIIISIMFVTLTSGVQAAPNLPRDVLLVERRDGVVVRIDIELAETAAARETGLMGRSALRARTGMLFDFGTHRRVKMWMKNTLIPLDMMFVDEDGEVIGIAERTVPHALDLIGPEKPIRYVLEINAGEVQRFGFRVGDRLLLR